MKPFRVLTIAGSDSGGGAGIQADLKTITVLGGFGMSVITALTAQNTLGVHGIHDVPPEFVAAQFDAVATDIGIDAAKTGMLATPEVLHVVAGKIRQYGIAKLVVDPVMVAKGGMPLIREEAKKTLMEELIPLAFILTPNIPEAEVLSGIRIETLDDMKAAARIIGTLGARHVVVKGGHLWGDAVDLLYDGVGFREFRSPRIATTDTHGTGCTYSAAIATAIACGKDVAEAVGQAKRYITEAVRHAWRLGGGHGPTNHLAPLFAAGDGRAVVRPAGWGSAD
jgi:hydroxymethylpyrimidine/phosphomethylpyrimidine kinase